MMRNFPNYSKGVLQIFSCRDGRLITLTIIEAKSRLGREAPDADKAKRAAETITENRTRTISNDVGNVLTKKQRG